jgi:hypothetical protein
MMNDNGIATCVPCRVGSYQPNSGQTVCVQCPEGFTTTQEGTIEKARCQGEYMEGGLGTSLEFRPNYILRICSLEVVKTF